MSQGRRTMWAELETGSSSVGPWTIPRTSARPSGIASAGAAALKVAERLCRRPGSAPAPAPHGGRPGPPPARAPQEGVAAPDHDRGGEEVLEVVRVSPPLLPVVADGLADQGEHQHPGDAAEQGEGAEAPERHLRDARRQR